MPKSAQEFAEITALIRGILNGYPGNSAIFREYLQNSDDAKATSQIFILDERIYPTNSLVDPALKETQGPALIAINDGLLRDVDWEALRKINSSSKNSDESQTGKNGLGFRASYHLTENPHVLSEQTLMILDPHQAFEVHKGGLSIDLVKEGDVYHDQIMPFAFLFTDSTRFFNGTAFRLPLRTQEQADRSRIKETPTSVDEIRAVLHGFVSDDLGKVILFLKHITTITIRHIDASGVETITASISIDPLPSPCPTSHTRNVTITSANGTRTMRAWQFNHYAVDKATAERVMAERLGYNIGDSLTKEKLVPAIDVAFPLDGLPIRGGLFTLLPFPQLTNFPLHLNAVFALTTDRQSLKNINEVGLPKSRERRLVEWNRTIFDTWTPVLWADMLTDLPSNILASASWSLWPPEERGQDCYWAGLSNALAKQVVSRDLALFPTHPIQTSTHLVAIKDVKVLIASPNPGVCLDTLCQLGVYIVQPPRHIFDILCSPRFQLSSSILSPQSLHRVLRGISHSVIEQVDKGKLQAIMDYLVFSVSPPNPLHITDLPWFVKTSGRLASFELASKATFRYFIPSSEEEAQVFASHLHMLSWGSFSKKLRIHLSLPATAQIINVTVMSAEDVFQFLSSKFNFPNSDLDEVSGGDLDSLIRIWSWLANWPKQKIFFNRIKAVSNLYLLPTTIGTLRKLSSGIISFGNTDASVIKAWGMLGVSLLHPDIPMMVASRLQTASYVHIPHSSGYIVFLIRNCNLTLPNVSLAEQSATFMTIRGSLYDGWPRNTKIDLSLEDKEKLALFPIFKVFSQLGSGSTTATASGHRIYVQIADNFPLPFLDKSEIYVDWTDFITQFFAKAIDSGSPQIKKEFDLIQLAVDNWALQPTAVQDRFIDQALQNWHRLPSKLSSDLRKLPFVIVNDTLTCKPPVNLIHPVLMDIYIGEAGRMPAGRFAGVDFLATFQSLGFLRLALDTFVIEDRLRYFSSSPLTDIFVRQKAIAFVQILDRHWKGTYSRLITKYRHLQWLPVTKDTDLVSPAQCRDSRHASHSHPYYYDLTLNILEGEVSSPGLRSALGWTDVIPSDVLVKQLQATLKLTASLERNNRLVKLLDYLDQLHGAGQLSIDAVKELRNITDGQSWVPISSHSSRHTVAVNHALISDSRLLPPFRGVDPRLKENRFLQVLGCTGRPSFDILMEEFNQTELTSQLGLNAALAILDEIATHHISKEDVRIPAENCRTYPLDLVYFRDMKFISPSPAILGMASAHNMISKALAEALGIQMLSSLALGDDEDDEEQMFEDLEGRISGFLRDYDAQYALNEFLANADDAGAHQFRIYLNQQTWSASENVISPGFQTALASPSLILFNDAKMSDQDFAGLRRVGQGGKLDQLDTHGRHGLGALSLYYFTDVVTVISGEFIMILDPSGRFLPPRMNKGKRTALKRTIASMLSMYPDQLKPCEMFGISAKSPAYDGTIFVLPLNSTISESAHDYSTTRRLILDNYRKLAQHAFFFTRLERISAIELIPEAHCLWEMSARKSTVNQLGQTFTWCNMYIKTEATAENEDTWLITTSEVLDIPSEHQETAKGLKLKQHSKMKVQLAISREKLKDKSLETYPFSVMVPPKPTSLPFHVNARFAISSNRQGIVMNSADSRSKKDAKSSFNTWILEVAVPPLYLASLEHLIHGENLQNHSFSDPRWWLLRCPDDISKVSRDGVFKALAKGEHRIFKSAGGQWVSFLDSVFSKEEPSEVKKVLDAIHAPKFVKFHRHTEISSIPSARIVDPTFVKETLQQTSLPFIRQMLSNNLIFKEDIFAVLDYIRTESPLAGLPLLILSSRNLIQIPSISQAPVYISAMAPHFSLFSSSSFINVDYSRQILDCLKDDDSANVVPLTEERVLDLIKFELSRRTGDEKMKWVHRFWRIYSTLPGPPSLESLETSGFSLIEGASGVISLRGCSPEKVVYHSSVSTFWPTIIPILQLLRIEVIKSGENPALRQFLIQRFPEPLENILKCVVNKGMATFEALPTEERSRLAEWIRNGLAEKVSSTSWRQCPPVTKQALLNLPIWEVHFDKVSRLGSASDIQVLPPHFSIRHITPYLRPNIAITTFSTTVVEFISFCKDTRYSNFRSMSCDDILLVSLLPTLVTHDAQVQELKAFIQAMLGFSVPLVSTNLSIPSRDGVLRPISELYDDNVPLFAQSLILAGDSSFVHAQFTDLVPRLRGQGLVYQITVDTFRICASAIGEAFASGVDIQSVRRMCRTAFGVFQSQLPRLIMLNEESWASLENIAFMLRKDQRRQGASYDVDRYFDQPLPLVMSPSRFVRPDLESIAWTQRALFFSAPSNELLAVNQRLGMPEVNEVVAHLIFLTTRIARDHPRDRVLLSDIKATYKWLNEHHEEARIHLLTAENEKIFLNVTDPEQQNWEGQWVAAKELVINLPYDTRLIKSVRDFLQSYENLLLAAGCGRLNISKQAQAPLAAGSENATLRKMKEQFNQMRIKNELTDVVLVPKKARELAVEELEVDAIQKRDGEQPLVGNAVENADDGDALEIEDENINKSQLRAHGVVLAAAIPHLQSTLHWPRVVETGEIEFVGGTPFGAKCVLDFVYTGELELSRPTDDPDILAILLRDLLELLPIVDRWGMLDLKEKVQWEIIHHHDMINHLPHGFDMMLEAAEVFHAEKLKKALQDFKDRNGKLLQDLREYTDE